ncbi:hypothetical protein OSH11_00060 [Kaistia dalseonensis]|uniref:Uncharacterized protein n=1 Tax=Kaistia dalseonensis TaxID=410840 RepID=A0ABU0H160_9HYPH|nr:hypothetical protein [Kaistia dalseonensis]MCX5493088.1 hypothetical protein [Kaistia dalseonensis]MDQ0435643.1 hypothetical protein [Kaistia dalseonensis]
MVDPFAGAASGQTGPATRHFAITPSDTVDLPIRPRALVFQTAGIAVLRDETGADIAYTRYAGDVLPLRAVRVLATGTTATLIGWV